MTPHSPRLFAAWRHAAAAACAAALTACTITPPNAGAPAPGVPMAGTAEYRMSIARRIAERNPEHVLHGTPQAMLRSLVVVSFTVDRNGRLVNSSVYRSNGDDEAEGIALASLRHAAPLPPPPVRILDAHGEVELMESWLFNDDGEFQLRTIASPQAQTLN
ncbi:energy transducer TonB family protein [Burkholderia singularis]|uniref:energy transducer TonB family protein n=1 Tax=Burkholderia singularis TaxID=1503053 RepID=UPI000B7749ED|nr:energy transducer TonB [Burkholderia singularis]